MRWLGWIALLTVSSCNREARDVAVEDAPNHKVSRIHLKGGQILFAKGGAYDFVCPGGTGPVSKGQSGCVEHHFYAFPVVPEGALDATRISAWVTCPKVEGLEKCREELESRKGEIAGSVAVRVGDEKKALRTQSGWEKAVIDAEKKHGLEAVPNGPVLRLE